MQCGNRIFRDLDTSCAKKDHNGYESRRLGIDKSDQVLQVIEIMTCKLNLHFGIRSRAMRSSSQWQTLSTIMPKREFPI